MRSARRGFSLIELLVAVAVFATMAALAYGGLDSAVRARVELGREQDAFRSLMRSVSLLERDLREAVDRPVRGNNGELLPALAGTADRIELTRIGFANPQAEVRANLERVFYAFDHAALVRGAYPVLDRAPGTGAQVRTLRDKVESLGLRYLDTGNRWSDSWPPLQAAGATAAPPAALPRAIEFRIGTADYGQITGIVELAAPWPAAAVEAAGAAP
jgi:general secretion pathway protein J